MGPLDSYGSYRAAHRLHPSFVGPERSKAAVDKDVLFSFDILRFYLFVRNSFLFCMTQTLQ